MHRIFDTIRTYHMIDEGTKVIAGVSGGADSVCLLEALCEYRREVPFEIMVVHVEHGIRGEESLADAGYVQELCRKRCVPVRVIHCEVEKLAKDRGLTVEEAGRMARYDAFWQVCRETGAHTIAVAHNSNDQAETVLWNLVRGSGLRGLGGIRPVLPLQARTDGADTGIKIIRPLLFCQRDEIESLLCSREISWRTDRTNLECDYTRNRIRLEILPALQKNLNAQAIRHISDASERLREVQEYLEQTTEAAAAEAMVQDDREVRLRLTVYHRQPALLQKELIKKSIAAVMQGHSLKNIGSVHLQALQKLTALDCGKECCLPGGLRVVREADVLRFFCETQRNAATESKKESGTGTTNGAGDELEIRREDLPEKKICHKRLGGWNVSMQIVPNTPDVMNEIHKEKKYTKWLSYDTINSNVCFRKRKTGDYLVVHENGGRKKLKDYMIDQKIPAKSRDDIWLLADGAHILWVVGWRISEAAKVHSNTNRVLRIEIEEEGSNEGES